MSGSGIQIAAASADTLRSIAHELRQPLSTIESIAYYLSLVLPRDGGRIQEQLTQLQRLVEQSNWILTSALQLVDAQPVCPVLMDLEELITQKASIRPAPSDIPLQLELAGGLPLVTLDPSLGAALIENLLMLFRQLATDVHPVTVRTAAASETIVTLEFSTAAPGFRSESALGPGAVFSLRSARGIMEAHNGSLELSIDPVTGIRLTLVFQPAC
jgi:signal transduction histidine kinase